MSAAARDLRTRWRPRASRLARCASRLARCASLAAALSLGACKSSETAPTAGPGAASASAAESPPGAPSARRPTRRYYAAHTREGCEVYSMDGDRVDARTPIPCPQDFLVGERIRLSGKTCMREGVRDPLPVVCPDPLTNLEKVDQGEKAPAPP